MILSEYRDMSTSLTTKERNEAEERARERFLEDYRRTGDIRKSMHLLDHDKVYENAPDVLFRKGQQIIREEDSAGMLWQGVLESRGVTIGEIADVLRDGMKAEKITQNIKTGETYTTPDYKERRDSAMAAALLWGAESLQKKGSVTNKMNIQNNAFLHSMDHLSKKLKGK